MPTSVACQYWFAFLYQFGVYIAKPDIVYINKTKCIFNFAKKFFSKKTFDTNKKSCDISQLFFCLFYLFNNVFIYLSVVEKDICVAKLFARYNLSCKLVQVVVLYCCGQVGKHYCRQFVKAD